jgi:hypothetical protein
MPSHSCLPRRISPRLQPQDGHSYFSPPPSATERKKPDVLIGKTRLQLKQVSVCCWIETPQRGGVLPCTKSQLSRGRRPGFYPSAFICVILHASVHGGLLLHVRAHTGSGGLSSHVSEDLPWLPFPSRPLTLSRTPTRGYNSWIKCVPSSIHYQPHGSLFVLDIRPSLLSTSCSVCIKNHPSRFIYHLLT